jgi:hypothetical protein
VVTVLNIILELIIIFLMFYLVFISFIFIFIKVVSSIMAYHLDMENLTRLTGVTNKYTKYLNNRKIKFVLQSNIEKDSNEKLQISVFLANIDSKEYLLVDQIAPLNKYSFYKFYFYPWMREINFYLKRDFIEFNKAEKELYILKMKEKKLLKIQMKINKNICKNKYYLKN